MVPKALPPVSLIVMLFSGSFSVFFFLLKKLVLEREEGMDG